MLSEPHLVGLIVAYKCGAFYKEEEASKTYQAFRTVKSFLDQNRHYSFTNTYQSLNAFIYTFSNSFMHFFIH